MIKASFHNHTSSDPNDPIRYSNEDLIDRAAEQGFGILSITCHNKFVFSEKLRSYAQEKNILLIPGIEISIRNRHVLILGATQETEKIHSFKYLRKYRNEHPECFIMANHPYFPGLNMFHDLVLKNIDCFDAVELSWWYSRLLNFNRRAKKLNLPMVGTSDTHFMKFHGITHCEIETAGKNQKAIFASIRARKFRNVTRPISIWLMMLMPFIAIRDKTWLILQKIKSAIK